MYIKENVIQRVISKNSYEIMNCCKQSEIDCTKAIREYLKEYLAIDYDLPFAHLYYHLVRAVLEICDEKAKNDILLHDIPHYYDNKSVMALGKKVNLNYEDLCNILIVKLIFTPVRDRGIDLFLIDIDGKLISISEYKEEKKLTLER